MSLQRFSDIMTIIVACCGLWTLFAVPTVLGVAASSEDLTFLNLLLLGGIAGVGPAGVLIAGTLAVISHP